MPDLFHHVELETSLRSRLRDHLKMNSQSSSSSPPSSEFNHRRNGINTAAINRWDPSLRNSSSSPPPVLTHVKPSLETMSPFFPGGDKSLASIATTAFALGGTLVFAIILALSMLRFFGGSGPEEVNTLWRAPFFLGSLALFHFLEFWVTASRNTMNCDKDSFLLLQNWPGWQIAHTCAFIELFITQHFFPNRSWSPAALNALSVNPYVAVGLAAVIVGQVIRTIAMYTAGASFHHQVQQRKAETHTLVTSGIYAVFRHPSYFGFFWWGLGTQLVLGNVICFFAYTLVLWRFFHDRIGHEEERLIEFFGDDYVQYRKRVTTWIPFIR